MDKVKKFTLSKAFIRSSNTQDNILALCDDLEFDAPLIHKVQEKKEDTDDIEHIQEKEDKQIKIAKRKPSAYNIFVKETLEKLRKSHAHLSGKEKFNMAILMWNENKNKN